MVAALVILALIALLVTGALSSSRFADRSVEAQREDVALSAAADFAAHAVFARSIADSLAELPLGQPATFDIPVSGPLPIGASVAATRLPNDALWIVADAELAGRDSARRRVNVVARWRPLLPLPVAPLMARGAVRLRGGLTITADSGGDTDCAASTFADVAVAPGAGVTSADPVRTARDPRAGDSAHYALRAWQQIELAGLSGAIHVRADTEVSNSSFQGVMIADGSVSIVGPFTGTGIIVARGPIVATTNELSLTGALLSFANPSVGEFAIDLAGGVVRFSPCVVARALRRIAVLRAVSQRNWTEVF